MPFLDAYTPRGALSEGAEREMGGELSDLLLEHQGVDPGTDMGRRLSSVSIMGHSSISCCGERCVT